MEKGYTRTGRRSKFGGARNSTDEVKTTDLVNGGSDKEKSLEVAPDRRRRASLRSNSDDSKSSLKDETKPEIKEEEKESLKETEKVDLKETEKVDLKETEKVVLKETEKVDLKETEKVDLKETENDDLKETEKGDAKEAEKDDSNEMPKDDSEEMAREEVEKLEKDELKETAKDKEEEERPNDLTFEEQGDSNGGGGERIEEEELKNRSPSTEGCDFIGFDQASSPTAASVINRLVGKVEADIEDILDANAEDNASLKDKPVQIKMLGVDIYTDSEDDSPKPETTTLNASKKRPLAQLTEEFDEKPPSPPPQKRARRKSAKAREAAGDSFVNMKVLSDASKTASQSDKKEKVNATVVRARAKATVTSNPLYLKPLDMGWKRELVYKKAESSEGKKAVDIFYYTPSGKKVRTIVELLEFIKDSGLSVENFSFVKEPLGIDDPEKEILRDNAQGKKQTDSAKKAVKTPKTKGANKNASPSETASEENATTSPTSSGRQAKSVTPRVMLKKARQKPGPKPKGTPTRKSLNSDFSTNKPGRGRGKKESSDEGEESGGQWSSNGSHSADKSSPQTNASWKSKNSEKAVKWSLMQESCSIGCIGPNGMLGTIPTLQCNKCFNFFHPECVGLEARSTPVYYLCKRCNPVAKDTTPLNVNGGVSVSSEPTEPLSQQAPSAGAPSSLVGGVTTWLPPSSTVQVQSLPRQPAPTPVPNTPPQTVATIGGQKFIVVPKHNVLSVSSALGSVPPAVANTANLYDDPQSSTGVYLVPYSSSSIEGASQYMFMNDGDLLQGRRGKTGDSDAGGTKQQARTMTNFMSDVSSGYGALFHVMGYLKVQELLRASRVCRMWRDLSLHPNLWQTVRMKNSQVCDWDGFAAALRDKRTRVLDLRKMLVPGKAEDIDNMWREFCRVIGQADSLQRIELSRCPANIIEQLAVACPQIRVINAAAIKSEEFHFDALSKLPLLEELRLRSVNGMNISSSLKPILSCRLRHLSITTIKNLSQCDLNVIGELTNLESLELGDCVNLNQDFGTETLAKLTKLQRVRLEKGLVPSPVISILESLSKLPCLQQLEIINCDVKPGFDKALAACKQVRRLLIFPTYIITSASTNHLILKSLPLLSDSLTHLVWGLTTELTHVTDLFIDQCEARSGKGSSGKPNAFSGECIPIAKPIIPEDKQKKTEENGDEGIGDQEDKEVDSKEEKMEVDKNENEDSDKSAKDKDETEVDSVESLLRGFRALAAMGDEQVAPSTPSVSIVPIPKLQRLLVQLLPSTHVKVLKVPYATTWRQTFPELTHF